MVLADLGADIVRIDRPGGQEIGVPLSPEVDILNRGRASLALDLKKPGADDVVLRLLERADGLLEGLRPGVMERLGLGPDICLARRPGLVYGRMTGWGQDGPLADTAGHDINYIALSGVLANVGRAGEKPVPPLNLVGDFGGGAMYLAVGMLAGILSARATGRGQVVDAAMLDGANQLMSIFHALKASGNWPGGRGENLLDGGAPYYDAYETKDGGFMAVGAIEAKFYRQLLNKLDLSPNDLPDQNDRERWPVLRERFAAVFKSRTRDEWTDVFDGSDACVSPVLEMTEVSPHPHNAARGLMVDVGGMEQPAPAPRFSATPASRPRPSVAAGQSTRAVLEDAGFSGVEIDALIEAGVAHEAAS